MIVLAIVLFVAAIIVLFVSFAISEDESKTIAKFVSGVLVFVSLALLVVSCFTIVKAGYVGVPVVFGKVQNYVVESGMHPVNPFAHIEQMSIRTENYWMSHQRQEGQKEGDDSVSVRASNGLQMPIDVSIPYRLIPESAPWIYENVGPNYEEKIIRVALSTATRRAGSHFTAEELYSTKRDEFAERIKVTFEEELVKLLQENYKGMSPPSQVVMVSQVLVGHVGIPDSVKNAIENKLRADQEQQAMDFQIQKEEKEAKRKKIEAEGIQSFQDIVSKGISEQLLRWKAIEATLKLAESNNAKIIVIGGKDGLPILLNSEKEKQGK